MTSYKNDIAKREGNGPVSNQVDFAENPHVPDHRPELPAAVQFVKILRQHLRGNPRLIANMEENPFARPARIFFEKLSLADDVLFSYAITPENAPESTERCCTVPAAEQAAHQMVNWQRRGAVLHQLRQAGVFLTSSEGVPIRKNMVSQVTWPPPTFPFVWFSKRNRTGVASIPLSSLKPLLGQRRRGAARHIFLALIQHQARVVPNQLADILKLVDRHKVLSCTGGSTQGVFSTVQSPQKRLRQRSKRPSSARARSASPGCPSTQFQNRAAS